jgi:hypothetical protein
MLLPGRQGLLLVHCEQLHHMCVVEQTEQVDGIRHGVEI